MYPDRLNPTQQYFLQNAIEVEQHLLTISLVIALAHLHLWQSETIAQKLQLFDRVVDHLLEIYISDNDGVQDLHTAINKATWWVPYSNRVPSDIPNVLESRMNDRTAAQIQHQLATVAALFSTQFENYDLS